MDFLAHALWTNAIYYKKYVSDKSRRYLAVFFGILPDLISFAPATLYVLFTKQNFGQKLFFSDLWVFRYAAESYKFTHSLVIFLVAFGIVMAFRRGKLYWPMFGWALHICIDIFTHKNFFETPFLFPLFDYKFSHGISWAEPSFMFINYGALTAVYLFIIYFKNRRHGKAQ